jgi:hypothetical protein
MTIVAPGSAQYSVGRRSVGVLALFVWACLLTAGGVLFWRYRTDRSGVFDAFTDTNVLLGARFGVALVAIAWIALLIDAWRMARSSTPRWCWGWVRRRWWRRRPSTRRAR